MRAGLFKILAKVPCSSTAVTTTAAATRNAALPKVFDRNQSLSPQVKKRFDITFSEVSLKAFFLLQICIL